LFSNANRLDYVVKPSRAGHLLDEIETTIQSFEETQDCIDFVQMRAHTTSVYADLELLEGAELQANLTIAATEFTSALYSLVLDIIARTCEIPMTFEYLETMLVPVVEALELENK